MKNILTLILIVASQIISFSQIEDCGQRRLLASIEDASFSVARGSLDGTGWKFADVYEFSSSIQSDASIGIQVEGELLSIDTIYICYPDIIQPTVVSYKGVSTLLYPWHYDYFDEHLARNQMAAIPMPTPVDNCPDTVWTRFELWYSSEGDARYKRRGSVYQYLNPVDSVAEIVEKEIVRAECLRVKKKQILKANSEKNIVLRKGYCTDVQTNNKDVLIVERGEILKYRGVKVSGDTIQFKKDKNFKITFSPGKVRLAKTNAGGRMDFISNTTWRIK